MNADNSSSWYCNCVSVWKRSPSFRRRYIIFCRRRTMDRQWLQSIIAATRSDNHFLSFFLSKSFLSLLVSDCAYIAIVAYLNYIVSHNIHQMINYFFCILLCIFVVLLRTFSNNLSNRIYFIISLMRKKRLLGIYYSHAPKLFIKSSRRSRKFS